MSDGLALYDVVRIVWRDTFATDDSWSPPERAAEEASLDGLHETAGLWFGVHGPNATIVRTRGCAPGLSSVDGLFSIPWATIVMIERLG